MSGAIGEASVAFREGRLADAVGHANAAVRAAPADPGARVLLAELLVFAGNLERADVILDAAGGVDPSLAVVVAEFRQLVRAEMARRQVFRDGRVPEFLGEPTPSQAASLAAIVALRNGETTEAAGHVAAAETARPRVSGRSDDVPFDDFRDGDDLLGGSLEVLTATGTYFWIPVERVALIEFHPPRRPRDLYWRRASIDVTAGPEGDVYIPAIYPTDGGDAAVRDALRLGRETDWMAVVDPGVVRGVGATTFLVGEEPSNVMELGTLAFDGH